MIQRTITNCLATALLWGGIGFLQADVKMPGIFGDHMVLQQETALPVWGTADPGEKVTVTVGTEKADAVADANGKWLVKLEPLPNGAAPTTMTVAGKNTLTFSDVLVGDVWVCSGQSNMETPINPDEAAKANDSQLRLFHVQRTLLIEPATDVVRAPIPGSTTGIYGTWMVCTPDTVRGISRVGYVFCRELRANLNRPIGMISSSCGGSRAEAWTSLSGLEKEPPFKDYVDKYNQNAAKYPAAMAALPAQTAAYQAALLAWNHDVQPKFVATHQVELKAWEEKDKAAKAAGQAEPLKPQPATPMPKPPDDPAGGFWGPTTLFNGMIAPLIPYGIKGVIWYQGENNTATIASSIEYRTLLERMITDWREKWGEGDFPFLLVQLASCDTGSKPNWPYLRESQLKTLELPNTGMASAVDLGDFKTLSDIHPPDKIDVGLRLALTARHVAYGQNLVYSGPIYDSFKVEGSSIRVNFTQIGSGLAIGRPPWIDPAAPPWPMDKMTGFEVAGTDGNYVPADARIDGNSVVVSSPQVTQPVYVRFAWSDVVITNLYNKEGLPAAPFRTDNVTPPERKPLTLPPAPPTANHAK